MKERNIVLVVLSMLLLFGVSGIQAQGDFVTLQGKEFRHKGQPFYLKSINYLVSIVNDNGTLYLAPHRAYDNNVFNCSNPADCYQDIVTDLVKIKSLGFNSIRLAGLPFSAEDSTIPNSPALYTLPLVSGGAVSVIKVPVDANYANLLDLIESALDAAEDADLKVQLIAGKDKVEDGIMAGKYLTYLGALATRFAANSTLYSYDFFNEPLYSARKENPAAGDFTRSEICSKVESWHNAIKSNAPNHLTTIGLATSGELYVWNPGYLKLDFLSFHLYPNVDAYTRGNMTALMAPVKKEVKWIGSTVKLPWIIGETGFRAADGVVGKQNYYYTDGSEAQQRTYHEEIFNQVRDCGGSGYTVWQYKDTRWGPDKSGKHGDQYGIVGYTNNNKLCASLFATLDPYTLGNSCNNLGDLYSYDQNLHPGLNPNFTYTPGTLIFGRVTDKNYNPVKHALVRVANIAANGGWIDNVSTFTNEHGFYVLPKRDLLTATAHGAKNYAYYFNIPDWLDVQLDVIPPLDYDKTLNNLTITSWFPTYEAENKITASNFTITSGGGQTAMNGGKDVVLKDGFIAQRGSNFAAYNEPVYVECDPMQPYFRKKGKSDNIPPEQPVYLTRPNLEAQEAEGTAEPGAITVQVYPNPSSGIFTINLVGNASVTGLTVYSALGESVYTEATSEENIDLSHLPNGTYFMEIKTKATVHSKMILIQK